MQRPGIGFNNVQSYKAKKHIKARGLKSVCQKDLEKVSVRLFKKHFGPPCYRIFVKYNQLQSYFEYSVSTQYVVTKITASQFINTFYVA